MGKNILILEGSPRSNGNSDMLAEAFATGARAKGYDVSVIKVPGYKVNGCFACGMCWSMGTPCVQSDDMEKIFPEIEQADMIVFASPLYFFSWPTQIKSVIDRLYPYALEKVNGVWQVRSVLCCLQRQRMYRKRRKVCWNPIEFWQNTCIGILLVRL